MKNKYPDTEKESDYSNLDKMTTKELLVNINTDDKTCSKESLISKEADYPIELLVGLIAATFATTDSALTTSFCVEFLGMDKSENLVKKIIFELGI